MGINNFFSSNDYSNNNNNQIENSTELNQINLKIINKKLKITINEINIIYTLLFQIIFKIFR